MGPVQQGAKSQAINERLINNLKFVQLDHSPNFGEILVYRINEKPFDYYMRLRQTCIDSSNTRNSIQKKLGLYKQFQSCKSIVSIEASFVKQQMELCSNLLCFDVYAKYHNFNLIDAIHSKINHKKNFPEPNLLYILLCLVSAGVKFKDAGGKQYFGVFKCDKVYLTTEGYIKIYPFHLPSINAIANFPQTQSSESSSDHVNELQIMVITRKPGDEKINKTYKDDIKDIASLIFQLIHKGHRGEYDFGQYKFEQTQKSLSRRISNKLQSILNQMLNLQSDCSYESIISQLTRMKQEEGYKFSYSIKLEEDANILEQEQERMQELQKSNLRQERLRRLSSLQQNLIPSRIFVNSRSSLHE